MSNDQRLRRAALGHLKRSNELALMVPPARIYSRIVPADVPWPFVRWGSTNAVPFRAAGMVGEDIRFSIDAFARDPAAAQDINNRIGGILDRYRSEDGAGSVGMRMLGSLVRRDGAGGGWHGITRFVGRYVAPTGAI